MKKNTLRKLPKVGLSNANSSPYVLVPKSFYKEFKKLIIDLSVNQTLKKTLND